MDFKKIGRNEPCPCGSGKKFKKCCGFNLAPEAEEILAPMPEDLHTGTGVDSYFDVFRSVMHYAEVLKADPKNGSEFRRVYRDFEERFKPGTEHGLPDSFQMNWFSLDNRFGVDQQTIIERMMGEKEFQTLPEEAKTMMCELADSYATCYEVKELRPESILFEELVTGRKWTVHRLGDPHEDDAKPGMLWHARFVGPQTDAYYFGQPFVFDPQAKSDFMKIVKAQIGVFKEYASTRSLKFEIPRDAFKAAVGFWAEYLYRSSSVENQDLDDEDEVKHSKQVIMTTDGEKIRLSSVHFKIIQLNGLCDKLSRMKGLEYDEEGNCWVWLKKGNRRMKSWENTVLGHAFIRENELVGEVNSLERALRLKNKLSLGLGKLVEFDRIDSKDLAAMPPMSEEEQQRFEEEQRRIHSDPAVQEVLFQRQKEYYLKDWITSKIPALNNRTPLQAVRTSEGRLQLEVLINRMEGMSSAGPDYLPRMDMNFLRQKLGLPLANRS